MTAREPRVEVAPTNQCSKHRISSSSEQTQNHNTDTTYTHTVHTHNTNVLVQTEATDEVGAVSSDVSVLVEMEPLMVLFVVVG